MSGASAAPPRVPPRATVAVPVENPSVWDRLTNWASENRTVVYTIAGVGVIVTGAGILYYLNADSVSFQILPYFCPIFAASRRNFINIVFRS